MMGENDSHTRDLRCLQLAQASATLRLLFGGFGWSAVQELGPGCSCGRACSEVSLLLCVDMVVIRDSARMKRDKGSSSGGRGNPVAARGEIG